MLDMLKKFHCEHQYWLWVFNGTRGEKVDTIDCIWCGKRFGLDKDRLKYLNKEIKKYEMILRSLYKDKKKFLKRRKAQ